MFPIPENEAERLEVLSQTGVFESGAEPGIDKICRRAAREFDAPIALVSLVGEETQRFKAACGLGLASTGRNVSFCTFAIMDDAVFVVEDARKDDRFSENPLVQGAPNIVFYAGAPLIYGDGIRLGSLCIIDVRPRVFGEAERERLAEMADLVSGEIWAAAFRHSEGGVV